MLLEACERAESIHPSHSMLDADRSMKMGDGEYGGGGQMQLSEELDEAGSWSPIPVDEEQDLISTKQDQPPIILTGSPDVEEHGCSILSLSAPPPTSQLWTSNLTPSQPANKLNDLHDARKMFDSIFDGIF
uniref:Uncharacterized protein n=1 Tax=Ciona savignyi TaxID=51511 RepID=H2YTA0_CIOSA